MAAFATAAELQTHLQRLVDPAVADLAIANATSAAQAYCGWALAREEATFQLEGDGGSRLTLPTLYLHAVDEVRVGDLVMAGLDLSGVVAYKKGQLYRPEGWPLHSIVEVDCEHGYDPLPDVLKLVVLDVATRSVSNPEALSAATVGAVSRVWGSSSRPGAADDSALSALHMRLLDAYSL
jgi:hypothetical protein